MAERDSGARIRPAPAVIGSAKPQRVGHALYQRRHAFGSHDRFGLNESYEPAHVSCFLWSGGWKPHGKTALATVVLLTCFQAYRAEEIFVSADDGLQGKLLHDARAGT